MPRPLTLDNEEEQKNKKKEANYEHLRREQRANYEHLKILALAFNSLHYLFKPYINKFKSRKTLYISLL
nr:hypothetical protein CFP56_68952 [Quercus suber]